MSAIAIVGSTFLATSVIVQEPVLQAQLDELLRHESLKQLLMDQQARMDAIEQQMTQQGPAASQARSYSSKNSDYSSKARMDDLTPLTPAKLVSMKRGGDTGSALQIYGFARLNSICDDKQASLDELLGYALSDDEASESDDLYLHPKLTRLGADLKGPSIDTIGGAEVTASSGSVNRFDRFQYYLQFNF